jgi:hypothetical protein
METPKTTKEILNLYFGANIYPAHITENYYIVSLSSSNDTKIADTLKEWKNSGYTTKKKSYSDFTHIKGFKEKN